MTKRGRPAMRIKQKTTINEKQDIDITNNGISLTYKLNLDSINNLEFPEIKKRMGNGGVPAGKEPHKLLLYFAQTLTKNDDVLIIAHDQSFKEIYNPYTNVVFIEDLNIDDLYKCNDYTQIIIDVDPHNGVFEQNVYDKCKQMNFQGIIIYDDTQLNDNMRSFWNSIPEENKQDLTKYGHWSGTGVVFFNKNVNFELD